jgi:hypothetical protein
LKLFRILLMSRDSFLEEKNYRQYVLIEKIKEVCLAFSGFALLEIGRTVPRRKESGKLDDF